MSKQGKRKITVDLPKAKDTANRPSVFERLGTKKSSGKKPAEHCRQWVQHGTCAYGKNCKFASTHILISPSKQRAANKDNDVKKGKEDNKSRLHSSVVVRVGRSPEGDNDEDNWDQNDLEYADTDVLEKRRQQLQHELELQLKMDSGKDMRKDKKKPVSSSSSSRSSSSSSASSSSSDNSSSSSSSGRNAKKKAKKNKVKRNSSSSSDNDVPTKKKYVKSETKKSDSKKPNVNVKKDDRTSKKYDPKKKVLSKPLRKKSLSPSKKSGGTPPITSKNVIKSTKQGKSPARKEKNLSVSPHSSKDREKDRKDKDKDREKDRNRPRSRSPRKARSRSIKRNRSPSKDLRRKDSVERGRPISPKKPVRRDNSSEKHRKRTPSQNRGRDNKDKPTEKRKDKPHDDKERHDRKDTRPRDRNKDTKRDDVAAKRRGRDRGLGRGIPDKGLEKPNKPMERLLPRPEERLAALAAISNRALDTDKGTSNSKDRKDERSSRKQERDRSGKRLESLDRDPSDYDAALERKYERGPSVERYERSDDRYDDKQREGDRSPGYMQGRDRHFDSNYDMPGPSRNYPEDDRMFSDRMGDRRGDLEYDERRGRERSFSLDRDRERGFQPHGKEWPEDFRAGGDWGRERHWPMHENQMNEWGDKDQEIEGWHHRGHPGPHRGRGHGDFGRGMRIDHGNKRRPQQRIESESAPPKEAPAATPAAAPVAPAPAPARPEPIKQEVEAEDNPIPDDLSEISDDPDDILNQDDMLDKGLDGEGGVGTPIESSFKAESSENQSTQDTNGATDDKEPPIKDEDENTNLDFEEISDGELEEERARAGVGDALGVDWASLVLEVRRREQAAAAAVAAGAGGGARARWQPAAALARAGLSVQMAGTTLVRAVLKDHPHSQSQSQNNSDANNDGAADESEQFDVPTIENLHPVAAIQVARRQRSAARRALFGGGGPVRRAVCARRDLALRRHLCLLPPTDRAAPPLRAHSQPSPHLFHAARAAVMGTALPASA